MLNLTFGELVILLCAAGCAGSLATMVILAKREIEEWRQRRRLRLYPVTEDSVRAAQQAAAQERANYTLRTGNTVAPNGKMLLGVPPATRSIH